MMRDFYVMLTIVWGLCLPALADVTIYPDGSGDYPTIQEGIDAVSGGETVWLGDGVFQGAGNRNLDYGGKNLTVRSISDDPAACIIDAESASRVFLFDDNEGSSAVVQGIGIQNGYALNDGGGIYAELTNPTIINCIISGCDAYQGGGVAVFNGAVSLYHCIIENNTASKAAGLSLLYNSPTLSNCIIRNNTSDGSSLTGAGIEIFSGDPVIDNCLITGNSGYFTGGLLAIKSVFTMNNCTIAHNITDDVYASGLALDSNGTLVNLDNCVIYGNTSNSGYPYQVTLLDAGDGVVLNTNHSLIEGGQAGVFVASGNTLNWGDGMLDSSPLFTTGPDGDYYLSNTQSGQSQDSPCLDAGSAEAQTLCFPDVDGTFCMGETSTRTDHYPDIYSVDIGYHYSNNIQPTPIPTETPTSTPTITPEPTATPPCRNDGDVNNSMTLTAEDAQITFNIVLGTYSPTAEELCSANCNGDGSVTAGDSQTIFFAVLGTDSCVEDIFIPTATPTCGLFDYSTDFTTMPPDAFVYDDAYHAAGGGYVSLTDSVADQHGALYLDGTDCALAAFEMAFDVYIGGGDGADGFSINFSGDLPPGGTGLDEEGAATGLVISCDTFSNDPGDPAPSITLRYNGVNLATQTVTLRTDTWVPMAIYLADNLLTLHHDGNLVFDQVAVPDYAPQGGWQFAWAARTGGLHDNHWIDNISISDYSLATPTPTNTPENTPTPSPTHTPSPTSTPVEMLDQYNTSHTGGYSNNHFWQSFTAGISGNLCRVEIHIGGWHFNGGEVKIYAGEGTTGELLATESDVYGDSYAWMDVPLSDQPELTEGSMYTIELSVSSSILYGDDTNPYPGGRSGYGTWHDLCFKTYMIVE